MSVGRGSAGLVYEDVADVFADACVVIVDDQQDNAVLLERILRSAEVTDVHTIMDPRHAAAGCRAVDADLVLLDLHMPGMDGHQVLAELRTSVPDGEFLPVLVVTADTSTETRDRMLQAGANDFLTKPLDSSEVVLRARNLLRTRALHNEMKASLELHRRRQHTILEVATQMTGDLDVTALADRIVHGVTAVTEFGAAVLTVRDGKGFRRVAASGVDDPRIGLRTTRSQWQALLRAEHRYGQLSYLIPPDEVAGDDWVQLVETPRPSRRLLDQREAWTPEHGLVLELLDDTGAWAGFLSVDAPSTGMLPDDETLQLLELFAWQAQAGLDTARLFERVRREREVADALRAAGDALASDLDLQETLERCCDIALNHSVGDRASIYLHDSSTDQYRAVMSRGGESDPGLWRAFTAMPPAAAEDVPVFAQAVRTGQTVLVPVVTTAHVSSERLELVSLKSLAAYPLRSDGRTLGVLVVDTFSRHVDFAAQEATLVRRIAGQAAVAIRQAQLHDEAQRQSARITALHELTKEMTRTLDVDTIFARIGEAISEFDYRIALFDVSGTHLRLVHTNVRRQAEQARRPSAISRDTMPARLWEQLTGPEPLVVPDVRGTALDALAPANVRSMVSAAHDEEDATHLVLVMTSDEPHAFDAGDAEFAQGLVETVALARRNARLYSQATQAAERDALTGLKNRRVYRTEAGALLAGTSSDNPVAMAVLDVDDFKAINDDHGHDVGDQVLVHVADRLVRSLREDDEVYRIGGEEFAVVMAGAGPGDATAVAERIRQNVAAARKDLPAITVSIGIAIAPDHGNDIDMLFRAADRALYDAKATGKDTVRVTDC